MEDHPPEVLMRGLLRAYYWMDESLQNGLQQAGYQPRTRTQTMILINISNGITRAAELARVLGVSRQAIQQQINELERDEDPAALWRRYANDQLKIYHQQLFDLADMLVYLQVPSFEKVYEWRGLQEQKLAQSATENNHAVMDEQQLARFIQHYERITRACLQQLPQRADLVLQLDEHHAIQSLQIGQAEVVNG